MAETPEGNLLTQAHARGQRTIVDEVIGQMLRIWPLLNPTEVDATRGTWLSVAMELILGGRKKSEDLSLGYLRAFYGAELPGYTPTIVRPAVSEQSILALRNSLEVSGPVRIKQLTGSGYSPEYASQSAFKASTGAAQRHVGDGGREAVIETAQADPSTMGWRRVIVGDTCPFCVMLADRGAVYSGDTVRFAAHDNDDCVAEPAIAGEPVDLMQYTASKRETTEAEKQRLKEYLHENYDGPEPRGSKGPGGTRKDPGKAPVRDVDEGSSADELRALLPGLENSYNKFPSPGTKRRIDDLYSKIEARS